MTLLGERRVEQVPAIPPGCPSLELALGCGGYPRGRIVEIYGPEGSGKTTLTLHAIAECQRAGGVAAFVDAEHALDVRYAKAVGVQADKLLVSQPDNGEQALEIVETLARSGACDLIVVDSVAALVPRAEIDGEMGDTHVGPAGAVDESSDAQADAAMRESHRHLHHVHQPAAHEDRSHASAQSRGRPPAATR